MAFRKDADVIEDRARQDPLFMCKGALHEDEQALPLLLNLADYYEKLQLFPNHNTLT